MYALLLVVSATTAVASLAPRAAEEQVSDKVIQAWKANRAEVYWVATSGLWDDKPTPGCRVGFRFRGWVPGRVADLPAPEGPFCIDVWSPGFSDEPRGVAKEITDEGLKELAGFQNLQSLGVCGENITDAGAGEITKLKRLEQLSLSCTKVTAAGLRDLAKLRTVTRLSLSQMHVTEEMLGEVGGFERLARFDLSFNKAEVTAAGMGHIAKLERLQQLSFFSVEVSEASVKEFGRSKSLKEIDFLNTNLTKADAEELRKLLPGCDVSVRTVDLALPSFPLPPEGLSMSEEPIRDVKPHWFDWGMFKANGELIFFTTAVLYLACIIVSAWLIRRIGHRLCHPRIILAIGLTTTAPMILGAIASLAVQMTSAHHQERTHIPAVLTLAASLGGLVIFWLVVEWCSRPTRVVPDRGEMC